MNDNITDLGQVRSCRQTTATLNKVHNDIVNGVSQPPAGGEFTQAGCSDEKLDLAPLARLEGEPLPPFTANIRDMILSDAATADILRAIRDYELRLKD